MPKLERPRRARRALTGLKAADLRVRPLARAETIPSAWYTDPCFHDLDRDAVFAATWQHVADVQQLAHPGDHVLADVAGEPIIVVRGSDGELRAMIGKRDYGLTRVELGLWEGLVFVSLCE